MRRIIVVLTAVIVAAAFAVPVLAVSPHFIRASGSLNANGSLTVSFKEAGLGTNQNITMS